MSIFVMNISIELENNHNRLMKARRIKITSTPKNNFEISI